MAVYLFNITWTLVMSIIAMRYSKVEYINGLQKRKQTPNRLFVGLVLLSFMSVYALRWKTGTDFENYFSSYFYLGGVHPIDLIGTRDWGFNVLTSTVYKIWPDNFAFYNYILAALTYIPTILILRKYSTNFAFSIMLYITMMFYYSGFNGVRQAIAVSICFLAYPLLYNKRYISYTIIIIISYLFHSTALLMIPFMLIVTRKAWSKTIISTIVILLGIVLFLPSIWNDVISFLNLIGQEKMANDYSNYNYSDGGINILRVLVALVPVLLSFVFYKKLSKNNSKIDILINMSLLNLVFLLFGTQMTVLARISNYFAIFNTLLIPEIANLFKGNDKVLFIGITLILFFIYMVLILPVDSNLLPYEFIFNQFK